MFDGNAASFDVTVDIPDEVVPAGMRPHQAVYRVREAVEAMPGARWVSVDYSGLLPPGIPWIVLYQPDSAIPMDVEQVSALAAMVEATARRALG